ncbi:MAG: hypothetical protein AAFY20_08095 [Cyanobacteria bacterium J06639_14]
MKDLSLPDELQVLAAGYVLGDLSSEEMAQFQQLLAIQPELVQVVTSLQETLALLPYGLPQQVPQQQVRSRLLEAAQPPAKAIPAAPSSSPPIKRRYLPWSTRLVASLAIVIGGCSLWLTHRVVSLQAQLATAERLVEIAVTDTTGSDNVAAEPSVASSANGSLNQTGLDLSQLVQDHLESLVRSQGPVDVIAADPDALLGLFPIAEQIPTIASPQITLLGGSHCQFGKAEGIRLTYQLPAERKISLYQIDPNGDQLSEFLEAQVILKSRNINLILWREENYLYALAAELPLADLQTLAQTMEPI